MFILWAALLGGSSAWAQGCFCFDCERTPQEASRLDACFARERAAEERLRAKVGDPAHVKNAISLDAQVKGLEKLLSLRERNISRRGVESAFGVELRLQTIRVEGATKTKIYSTYADKSDAYPDALITWTSVLGIDSTEFSMELTPGKLPYCVRNKPVDWAFEDGGWKSAGMSTGPFGSPPTTYRYTKGQDGEAKAEFGNDAHPCLFRIVIGTPRLK